MSERQDSLVRAARAVRETYDGTSGQAAATRRSLMVRAGAAHRRQRKLVVYLLPLAAALALSTAWAAVTGHLWSDRRPPEHSVPSVPAPGPERGAEPDAVAAAPLVPPTTNESTADEAAPDEGAMPPPSSATSPRAAPSTRSSAPFARALPDAEESLYATAHRLHFVARDPGGALKGWDAYLAEYPNGRFALEARYNRALSLVRLDRHDEARAALAPFANGTDGGYRQREARELDDALRRDP